MKHKERIFLLFYVIKTILVITLITKVTKLEKKLEQHSVHPIYGNYLKINSLGNICHPWDYCEKSRESLIKELQTKQK